MFILTLLFCSQDLFQTDRLSHRKEFSNWITSPFKKVVSYAVDKASCIGRSLFDDHLDKTTGKYSLNTIQKGIRRVGQLYNKMWNKNDKFGLVYKFDDFQSEIRKHFHLNENGENGSNFKFSPGFKFFFEECIAKQCIAKPSLDKSKERLLLDKINSIVSETSKGIFEEGIYEDDSILSSNNLTSINQLSPDDIQIMGGAEKVNILLSSYFSEYKDFYNQSGFVSSKLSGVVKLGTGLVINYFTAPEKEASLDQKLRSYALSFFCGLAAGKLVELGVSKFSSSVLYTDRISQVYYIKMKDVFNHITKMEI